MVEMKPKEFVLRLLSDNLVSDMENIGFKYSKDKLELYKNFGVLKLNLRFELDRYNFGDYCNLSTSFSLTADSYRKWYFDEWGRNPEDNSFISMRGVDIPNWKSPELIRVDLNDHDASKMAINSLKEDIIEVGINYFMDYTYWESVAEYLLKKNNPDYLKAGDMYLMAKKHEKAFEIYNEGLTFLNDTQAFHDSNAAQAFNDRIERYF